MTDDEFNAKKNLLAGTIGTLEVLNMGGDLTMDNIDSLLEAHGLSTASFNNSDVNISTADEEVGATTEEITEVTNSPATGTTTEEITEVTNSPATGATTGTTTEEIIEVTNDEPGNDVTQENSEEYPNTIDGIKKEKRDINARNQANTQGENSESENDNQGNIWSLKEQISKVIDTTKETITAGVKGFVTNLGTSNVVSQFLQKATQYYDEEDALELKERIQKRGEDLGRIKEQAKICVEMLRSLDDLTKDKLTADHSVSIDGIEPMLNKYINGWDSKLQEIADELAGNLNSMKNTNEESSKDINTAVPVIKTAGNSTSGSSRGGSSSNKPSINEIVIDGGGAAIALAGAIVGVVKFKEIVTMYENIGSGTGVQASLTGNYGLVGIVKDSGKNYYKILDKDTNKVYYIEINDKVEIQTDLNKLLEVNDKAMMLTTTEIGSDNFSKFADTNTLYFIQNEVQKDNINFMNVIDSSDGKDYYIPLSDSVNIVSLDSVIKPNEGTIK